jgi:hypothetical protein
MALCFALLLELHGGAQVLPNFAPKGNPLAQSASQLPGRGADDGSNGNFMQEEKLLQVLNADRQKSMVSDANKLLRLVDELNSEIDRTNPDSLSEAQLRKVAQIEKLARSVRDKMSTSVRGVAPYQLPAMPRR